MPLTDAVLSEINSDSTRIHASWKGLIKIICMCKKYTCRSTLLFLLKYTVKNVLCRYAHLSGNRIWSVTRFKLRRYIGNAQYVKYNKMASNAIHAHWTIAFTQLVVSKPEP
jgi:hypothetical protein